MEWYYVAAIIVSWLVWSGLVAWIGARKGRGWFNWLLLALVLSPLVALIAVLVVEDAEAINIARARQTGISGNYRKCPSCSEVVQVSAVRCRYCHVDLNAMEPERGWRPRTIPDRLGFPPEGYRPPDSISNP